MTACRSMSPLGRLSRETTTRPPPTQLPNAAANDVATAGVSPWPTIPRIPETETIRSEGMTWFMQEV